jgi:cytochrome c-type biogenesis protein CcmH
MLAGLPAESQWRVAVEQAIAQAQTQMAAAAGPRVAPGPDQAQVDAAADMSDADRNAMIETMVSSLDEKLRENPKDPEGWSRLVRSYVVLGKADAAREALKRGVAALGEGSDDAKRLVALSAMLGLTATE